jgi:dihydroxy-acid dehydratase
LLALARRAGVPLTLERFDELSRTTPVVGNLRPSGEYLMEDFHRAGGMRALLAEIASLLDLTAGTVSGRTLGAQLQGVTKYDTDVIRTLDRPLFASGGTCVLRGNLAPSGCVIKVSAASPELLQHRGPALVFHGPEDLKRRIHAADLPVTADSVLVLQSSGPLGAPGFPEWGMLPIPEKLLRAGVRDMVRLSDARMSGTSYGTCVLHVSPESHAGGPLALVQDGDPIELDVAGRRLIWHVDDSEAQRRRAAWQAPPDRYERGYGWLFARHVTQAHEGCDFDFLADRAATREPDIY